MNMPCFSIIIPVYNVAPYLRECLDSVLAQTFADWEAVCVDDGSSDGSDVILQEYAERDSRFKVIHKENEGVSIARNTGLRHAIGEYFMFLDSDDYISPDALQDFSLVLKCSKYDGMLVQSFQMENGVSRPLKVVAENPSAVDLLTGKFRMPAWTVCRIYKRSTFGHLTFIPGMKLREDLCFWSDALCISASWVVVDKPFYYYRRHAESASSTVKCEKAMDLLSFPIYVMRNMRDRMKVGDVEVGAFWRQEVRTLALDRFFRCWHDVPKKDRDRVLSYARSCIEMLGHNPLRSSQKLCLRLAEKRSFAWLVTACYFVCRVKEKFVKVYGKVKIKENDEC